MDVQCTTTKAQRLISFSTVGKLDNNVFLKADVLPNQSRTSVHSAGVFATSTDIVKDTGSPVAMLLQSYGSIEGKYSMKVQNAVSKGLIQMSCMKKHRHWNLRTQRNLVPKRLSDICFKHHKGSDDVSEKIPTVPPLLLSAPVFSSHSALKKSLEGAHGPTGSLQHNGISEQV
ncbi:hypothetical protein MHYP_G00248560 [Metynnis hypsauchen]